ncbi:MAG: hypothetical protein JO257_06300 [Deltaproteobacteria bacterium]|nr:hypothetical protein [Deltaproteobacteria bacterium]
MRTMVAALLLASACYSPHPQAGAPCPDNVCPTGLVCSPVTHTCETTAQNPDGGGPDAPPDVAADANVDANTSTFLHRRRVTIHNGSGQVMPAGMTVSVPFGVLATLVSAGKAKADFSDVRVIGDNVGERDRIIDPPGGVAPVMVSFSLGAPIAANATSTEYAIYYSYANAGAAPANGHNVFPVYDDFSGPISTAWLKNDAPQVTGGMLVLRGGHTDAITTTASADNIPVVSAVELVAKVQDTNSNPTTQPEGTFYYWFGYQHTGDFSASEPWVVWIARGKGGIGAEQKSPVGCEAGCEPAPGTQDTAFHYYVVARNPGETRFFRDGAVPITITVQNTEDYSLMVRNYMATSDLDVDWIRGRARVNPDPTVTTGPEENL